MAGVRDRRKETGQAGRDCSEEDARAARAGSWFASVSGSTVSDHIMASIWNTMQRAYHVVNYEWPDPRAQPLPLVTRPFTILGIMAGYTLFVKRIGPWIMRDRKPFVLTRTLVVYNILQIVANLYIFYMTMSQFWLTTYTWTCEPIDRSNSPSALEMLRLVNIYFWMKIADLMDTVFFVLRKKVHRITSLHVYHHSMMVFLSWNALKYFPGGHGIMLGTINALVRTIIFTYYLVAAIYPNTVWWKKYVSQIQLVQYVFVMLHEGQIIFRNPCNYPLLPPVMLVPQTMLMLFFSLRPERRAYGAQPALKTSAKAS